MQKNCKCNTSFRPRRKANLRALFTFNSHFWSHREHHNKGLIQHVQVKCSLSITFLLLLSPPKRKIMHQNKATTMKKNLGRKEKSARKSVEVEPKLTVGFWNLTETVELWCQLGSLFFQVNSIPPLPKEFLVLKSKISSCVLPNQNIFSRDSGRKTKKKINASLC